MPDRTERTHPRFRHRHRHRSLSLSISVALALAIASFGASATAGPADLTQAEALFNSGKDAMAHGDLVTACARFGDSLKLDPAVGTLLNLAACEEKSGKIATALEHFTTARSQLPKDDFRIAFTSERIAALTPRVAHVTLRVATPAEPGTKVLRDGIDVPPAAWNAAMVIDPGAHTIEIESAAHAASRIELNLREGDDRTLDVGAALAKAPPKAAADHVGHVSPSRTEASTAPVEATSRSNALAYVATSVGVAGLVAGTVTGLMALHAATTYKDHCHDGECDGDGLSAASTGRATSVISPVAFGVGVVGVALGTYLFLRSPPLPSKPSAATTVAPMVSPFGGSVTILRTF